MPTQTNRPMPVSSPTFPADEPVLEYQVMTTSIDQAFRKAYAKRTGTSGSTSESANGTIAVWIDEPSGQFFRNEPAHAVGAPHFQQAPATELPVAESETPAAEADKLANAASELATAPQLAAQQTPAAQAPETPAATQTPAEQPIAAVASPLVSDIDLEPEAEPMPYAEPLVSVEVSATNPQPVVRPIDIADDEPTVVVPAPFVPAPVVAKPAIEPQIDIRPGTTAYDAWSAKLETLELPKKAEAPLSSEPTISKQAATINRESLPAFAPVWEVDEFVLPEVAKNLATDHLLPMGAQLERASREGLQTMAVSSQNRDTGRSTVAIAIAQVAATAGLRVALVDADTENPSLLEKLQLEMSNDWVDAIAQDVSIEEVAVLSLSNNFCFLPLLKKSPEQLKQVDRCAASLLERLKLHFDLIVVDFGPLHHASFGLSIPLSDEFFDAVVLIEDMRRIDPETLETYARRIRAVGIENIGLIENYTDADAAV